QDMNSHHYSADPMFLLSFPILPTHFHLITSPPFFWRSIVCDLVVACAGVLSPTVTLIVSSSSLRTFNVIV
ncbi:hypothetical protein BJV78DRAFT_1184789, partial [Lactifluus subvellereus]